MNLVNLKKALDVLSALEQAEASYLEAHQTMDGLSAQFKKEFSATNNALNELGVAIEKAINYLNEDCESFEE